MKRTLRAAAALWAAAIVLAAGSGFALQPGRSSPSVSSEAAGVARAPSALQRTVADQARVAGLDVQWDGRRGVPNSVRGEDLGRNAPYTRGRGLRVEGRGDYSRDAVAVVDNLAGLFGVRDAAQEFGVRAVRGDAQGRRHVRLAQRFEGLRVAGGELIVHFDKRGRAYEVNGQYVPDLAVDVNPLVSAAAAQEAAAAWLAGHRLETGSPQGEAEAVVLARGGPARLAWQLVRRVPGGGETQRWQFWVDARDGAILRAFDNTQHIDAPTGNGSSVVVSGQILAGEGGGTLSVTGWLETVNGQYYLHNTGSAWQVYNVASSGSYPDLGTYAHRGSNSWAASDPSEMSAAVGLGLTQRYYRDVQGLSSFDGSGIMARGNVHEGVNYVNAYWNGTDFHFGDGDGVTANSLAILDVVGHEFTHAVTENSANLIYQNEPGALNESFSDVMGACIEFYAQPDDRASYPARHAGEADWLLGEDCWLSSTALRDMRDPANTATVGSGNEQPTRYLGTHWYSGSGDNGGVHYNSGVQNFFFYLLCEGGTGTNDGIPYDFAGIGVTQAQFVALQALTAYCTPDTDYRSVRGAWLSAALDVNPAWASNVAAAWSAVGVDALAVSPAAAAPVFGEQGGPFTPAQQVFVLTNLDTSARGWGVAHTQSWLEVSPAAGSLDGLSSQSVTVTVAAAAASLPAGSYVDTLVFTNSGSASTEQRDVTITVTPPVIYTFPLDSDPGWTAEGQWAWGVPTGGGSGNHDPSAGHTGGNVYGYNLDGDYSNNMARYYLTSAAMDCAGMGGVQVSFWRWLGVENATWDHAVFEASNNGVDWSNVWDHTGATISDAAWTYQVFDLSALADGQPTVYLRWGMGPSDVIIAYPGWNIDDISIHAQSADDLRVTPGAGLSAAGVMGGPFAPTSQSYVVRNAATNGQSLTWSASAGVAWLSVSETGGTLAAGASVTSVVQVEAAALVLPPGQHSAGVLFSNVTSGFSASRPALLTVLEPLVVSPTNGWSSSGYAGGPFAPTSATFVVTNRAAHALGWGVAYTQAWVSCSAQGGLLAAGSSTQVVVSLNAGAEALPVGIHADDVTFTNTDTAAQAMRTVQLRVVASPRMDVSPAGLYVTNAMGSLSTSALTVANSPLADADLDMEALARETGESLSGGAFAAASSARGIANKPPPGFAYVEGELLVRFQEDLDAAQRDAVLASLGAATVVRAYRLVPGLALVRLGPGLGVTSALAGLRGNPAIHYAQPNYRQRALDTTPNDARFDELWGLHNTGQTGGTPDADIDAPAAWDITRGDTNVIVAIIDTGIDYQHEDVQSNLWVNAGEIAANGLDDDANGYVDDVYGINGITGSGDPQDDHDHGTHCAGTVGGVGQNAVGVVGVNWRVRLMACKFLDSSGSGSTADAITCVEYATLMGARVLSNSWGGGPFEQALLDAIEAAGAAGVTFVAAAGNNAMDTDVTANYPSCYTSANLIAVMAVDHNDARSGFSNYGVLTVDLGAPGSGILSCRRGGGYQTMSGTSMATPHVAGACALLLAAHPGLRPDAQRQVLMDTADATLPGLCVSGGRLNLARAVAAVLPSWLSVQPMAVAGLAPGFSTNLAVTFSAVDRAAGVYTGEVLVTGNDFAHPVVSVPAILTVLPDDLRISPATGFSSSGQVGGPFAPAGQVYVLSNAGPSAIAWTVHQTATWLNVSSAGGGLDPGATTSLLVSLSAESTGLAAGTYVARVSFTNASDGVGQPRQARLDVAVPWYDRFTQLFASDNDLDNSSIAFAPSPGLPYYEACRSNTVTAFPTDPAGGSALTLSDDSYVEIALTNGLRVPFYGEARSNLFVGSNGYLTFGGGDTDYEESLGAHFLRPRVAALYDDLNPASGGTVSWKQLTDRVAVTWQDVPQYGESDQNSFQVELFSNGTMRITWLGLAAADGLAGLSEGEGTPAGFVASDLTAYGVCGSGPLLVITNPVAAVTVPATQDTYQVGGAADTNVLAGELAWSNEWSGVYGTTNLSDRWVLTVPLAAGTNVVRVTATNRPQTTLLAADHGTNAAYADGWQDGDNGGAGWAAGWELLSWNGTGSFLITGADPGNLSAGPQAWTLAASNGATAEVRREFAQALSVGQTFSLRFDNNWIENGNSVGVGLQNQSGGNLFEFMFIGGSSTYLINDSTNGRATPIPWSGDGWDVSFSLTAAGHYVLTCGAHVVSGQLSASGDQAPVRFKAWNYSAGSSWQHNVYFNDLRLRSALPAQVMTSVFAIITRPANPDSDEDGMADDWETANGLIVGVDDSLGNPDGDGWLNWQEYVADTPAQVSNGALRVQIQIAPDGVTVVAGPATTNSRQYDLQVTTNLPAGAWVLVESNVTGSADGGPLALPATNVPSSRALRVGVHLP